MSRGKARTQSPHRGTCQKCGYRYKVTVANHGPFSGFRVVAGHKIYGGIVGGERCSGSRVPPKEDFDNSLTNH